MDRRQTRAFEAFVTETGDGLLRVATLLTATRQSAEDMQQEALQRLARRWGRVQHPRAFCLRVMHNLMVDQARARERRPAESQLLDGFDDGDPRSMDAHAAVEIRPALHAALDTLTPQQRAVVVLRYLDDRSEAEVADLLGISIGTVKSTASRAMSQLRDLPVITDLLTTDHPIAKGNS